MKRIPLAALLALSVATPALADVCDDHGFRRGTMEYLECWRYVNHQETRERDYLMGWGQAAQGWANEAAPTRRTYSCTDAWGRLARCVR